MIKLVIYDALGVVGCVFVTLCFLRGLVGYAGNLLDIAIYRLHVKNTMERKS